MTPDSSADHDPHDHAEPRAPRERAAQHALHLADVSPAPRPLPMSACAAIARASRANAAVEKIVNDDLPAGQLAAARGRSRRRPSRAARRADDRSQEQPAARAREPRTPPRCGRRDAACRRASRPTTSAYAATMAPLRHDGAGRRARDAPPEPVDEAPS